MRWIARQSVPTQLATLVTFIGLLALAGWAKLFFEAKQAYDESAEVAVENAAGDMLLEAIRNIQFERGLMNGALQAEQPATAEQLRAIETARHEGDGLKDQVLDSLEQRVAKSSQSIRERRETLIRSREAFHRQRAEADKNARLPKTGRDAVIVQNWYRSATSFVSDLYQLWEQKAREAGRLNAQLAQLNRIKYLSGEMRERAGQDRATFESAIIRNTRLTDADLQRALTDFAALETQWAGLLNLTSAFPGAFDEAIAKVSTGFLLAYTDLRNELIDASRANRPYTITRAEFREMSDAALRTLAIPADRAKVLATEALARGKQEKAARMRLALASVVVSLLVVLGTVCFVILGIARPISRMTGALSTLAAGGDIGDQRVFGVSRELFEMAKIIQVFKRRLEENRALTASDANNKNALQTRQEVLEAAISRFDQTARTQLDQIARASIQFGNTAQVLEGTVADTADVIGKVGSAAQLAAEDMQASAATVTQMSNSIEEIAQKIAINSALIGDASERAEQAGAQSESLSASMSRITEIVTMVSQIAQQTNLLALNATIEAARAGESGRGFAVVASEVKTLAAQTSGATGEIGGQIESVRGAATGAIATVQHIRSAIHELQAASAIISSAVEEQNISALEISRTVQQTAGHAGDVMHHMEDLSAASVRTQQAATEARDASGMLVKGSEELRTAIDTFLATVRAA